MARTKEPAASPGTIRCPSCGNANRPTRRYCAECGSQLGEACPACGTRNDAGERFCGSCGGALTGTLPEGERRQLTVLFCDLVGSTAIAGQLDPEDWREVSAEYQRAAAETVTRFAGHVAKYLGDGLLVYFGYPQAHEDDPERAVRAGLALLDKIAELNRQLEPVRGVRLAVRVGIHTGAVVIGEGATAGAEVFGETPNIAARLQTMAEPDTVLITEATHRLVSGRFIVEAKGAPPLKGVRQPVAVFRVLQASGVRSRLAAAGARGLTPFVGREAERRLLAERWAQVRAGEGQVVLITGEAGIGKSRLVQTFKEEVAGDPHTWIECVGSPYHQNTPFFPVVDMLQQGLAWRGDESPAERLHGLERALALAGLRLPEAVPLVAPLLSLPVPEQYPLLLASPEQRRKLLGTLTAWLFGAARVQPLVLAVEDLQWVDPSTLELQGLFVERGATAPVLLLYTARPEFRAPWPLLAHHAQVTLGRLGHRHVREMVAHVAPRAVLAEPVIEALVTRTDGNPLYVEELTKAVLEADAGGAISARPIPATLQDSLMARLDRLGGAKEVAQVGAVIGREFSYALLHAVLRLPDVELQAALARLADAELLYPRGLLPEATYVFKHALVQDTAYASLLKSRRRELHGAIARVLAERFHDTAETQPELLAVHYTEAGEAEPAVAAWQRAGERAFGRGALAEAVSHLRRGLAVVATLPESPARAEQEFRLQLPLGQALMVTQAFASPEAAQAFARARVLSAKLDDPVQVVLLLYGLFSSVRTRDGPQAAQPLADQALAAAEQAGRPPLLVVAHHAQAQNRFSAGDLAGAREHCGRALALYDEATQLPGPLDIRIRMLPSAAWTAWHLGHAGEARGYAREAVELAERTGRAGADPATVEAMFHEALTVARRQGAKAYELRAGTRYALFLRAHGRIAEARELLAPIYASFTEGFDTRDLIEAKALLEELA